MIDCGVNYVAAAHDIRLNCFERVVFAGRHLLERRRVNRPPLPREGPFQALRIPHITEK